jgi:hypothetical protein
LYRTWCFCRIILTIPPQIQVEIAEERIITDEHSGRILVDAALADEERKNGTTFAKCKIQII